MERDVTSRRLRHASELMLLIPVRKGFVEGVAPLTSYASRLRRLLESLSDVRRVNLEQQRLLTADPIDALRSIYVTQWAVLERPGSPQLMVCSSFDRSWEDYFHLLVDRTGALLDAIFCHCEDYAGNTCRDGFERFTRWIRRWQQPCSFFYVAAPDITVDDLRHARKHLAGVGNSKLPFESLEAEAQRTREQRHRELALQMKVPEAAIREEARKGLRAALSGYYEMSQLFPITEELKPGDQGQAGQGTRTARDIFNEAMELLLRRSLADDKALEGLRPEVADWANSLRGHRGESAGDSAKDAPVGDASDCAGREARQSTVPSKPKLTKDALQDIQSNILFPHVSDDGRPLTFRHGCVVLVQCDDGHSLRKLLDRLLPHVSGQRPPRPDAAPLGNPDEKRVYMNLALTYAGLSRLELGPEVMHLIPKEFREGMAARATVYGDVGYPNHPGFWKLPEVNWPRSSPASSGERVELSTVDVVLVLMAQGGDDAYVPWSDTHPLRKHLDSMNVEVNGARILHVQALYRNGPAGHFGLVESPAVSSQPVPDIALELPGREGQGQKERDLGAEAPARDVVPLGELLLGYPDRRGQVAECAVKHKALFHNGTFLVMRKLEQHVDAFQGYVERTAAETGAVPQRVRGWIVGRDDDGAPLTPRPAGASANDFDYQNDPGTHCPFHAHIRLANPRDPDEPAPRIMRRGFSFGPPRDGKSDEARGLMFMAYNASIASQFEVVQRWLNGGNSTGLPSTQNDILVGVPQPSAMRWVIDGGTWKPVLPPERPLVSLRWGLYLFVPSLSAIKALAEPPKRPLDEGETLVEQGKRLVEELKAIQDPRAACEAWKQALEEDPRSAEAIWTYVRSCDEPTEATHYGLLVGKLQGAKEVLSDSAKYSVEEYGERLQATIGLHYLGLDRGRASRADAKTYDDLSRAPNAYLRQLAGTPDLFARAHAITRDLLEHQLQLAVQSNRPRAALDLRPLVKTAIARLAQQYLGMPAQDDTRRLEILEAAILVSRYCFQPYPDEALKADAHAGGARLRAWYGSWRPEGPMAEVLRDAQQDEDEIRLAIVGALVGFAPPAVAGLLGALLGWLELGVFWRLRMRCIDSAKASASLSAVEKLVVFALVESLFRRPVPPLLYRTLRRARPSASEVGDKGKVIVGLQSVMQEARGEGDPTAHQWLFGGEPGPKNAVHGCPAREPALRMLAGIAYGLLTCKDLRQERSVLVSFSGLDPEAPPPQAALA